MSESPSDSAGEPKPEPTRVIPSKTQQALLVEANGEGIFKELPKAVATDYRRMLGIFAAPGIRAVTYVLVDGEPWPKTFEARDYITFQAPGAEGRVDIRPFGQPCGVAWRPDAGETDASVSLDLHQQHADSDATFLAVNTDSDEDPPHIVIGWHHVPIPEHRRYNPEKSDE